MTLHPVFVAALASCALIAGLQGTGSAGEKILFDEGHGQRFRIGQESDLDLSALAETFRQAGAETSSSTGALTAEALAGARALVISGPFQNFSAEEIEAVAAFVEGGGRLALMLHIPHTAQGLMLRLGINFWNGVVAEEEHLIESSPQDFYVSRFEPHPLTEGLERFAVYGTWAVASISRNAMVIARTGPRSWIDGNRDRVHTPGEPRDSFGIIAYGTHGKGAFVVFGDDAIFQNRFLREHNRSLAENLARWLVQ